MDTRGRPTAGQAGRPRLTKEEWLARRRRKRLRLVRNWVLFLSACGAAVGLMTGLILWTLPRVSALLAPAQEFTAPSYDLSGYVFDGTDPYLVLVNANLPLDAEPAPALAVADEAAGIQLEEAAAAAWKEMAAAAEQVGVHLRLVSGYRDAAARQAAYDAWVERCLRKGRSQAEAEALAAGIQPPPAFDESATGLAAGILSEEYGEMDTGFADTDAYRWLEAYAADYGFILRWPADCQAATGMVFQPWHWRYVGVANARAIRASGLCLEEFLAVQEAAQ